MSLPRTTAFFRIVQGFYGRIGVKRKVGGNLGDCFLHLAVIGAFVRQCGDCVFNSGCIIVYRSLLGDILSTDNSGNSGLNGGEVLVITFIQSFCLCNGCIYCGVIRGVLIGLGRKNGAFFCNKRNPRTAFTFCNKEYPKESSAKPSENALQLSSCVHVSVPSKQP